MPVFDFRLESVFVLVAVIALVAVLLFRLSTRLGVSVLLLYFGLGVLLGTGLTGVGFDDVGLARDLSTLGLVLILAGGGLTTRWANVRAAVPLGLVLATVGVLLTTLVVAVATHFLLSLDWQLALLFGAATAPTDTAAIFAALRRVRLPPRLRAALEVESSLNDAVTVLLVSAIAFGLSDIDPVGLTAGFAWALIGGALFGTAIAVLGAMLVRRVVLPGNGPTAVIIFALIVLAFGGAQLVGGSGFVAVYAAALVLGNSMLPARQATADFAGALIWLAEIGLFIMLGLLWRPDQVLDLDTLLLALVLALVLLLVARPVAVLVAATPFGVPWREQAFMAWAGMRGAAPIVVAISILASDTSLATGTAGTVLLDASVVLVVMTTLLQSPTLAPVARRLGISPAEREAELTVTHNSLDDGVEYLAVWIPYGSRLAGVRMAELRLPSTVTAALREPTGRTYVPSADTRLRVDDYLIVLAAGHTYAAIEKRLQSVHRGGALAGWK